MHINWLTAVLLGKELVSKEDLAELKKYGKLSLDTEVNLIERAFSLGRLSATKKKSEYSDLTLEKLSRFEKRRFSSSEKLAIREAKLHADRHIQAIVDEVTAEATSRISQASSDLISDVMRTLKDELAVALAEKKTAKELAAQLTTVFNTGFKRDWKRFATTELHRAKVRGAAMAIANKVDIYAKSDGIDSTVSVVPNKEACKDCLALYLDDKGNPRVVQLKDLVSRGTNAAVKHTRNKEGLHNHWKAVMPPAHPNCYCSLVYVPPGMSWENGKLLVSDKLQYKEHLSKAVDKGSMSPVVKPPGPKKTQGMDAPKPGSIQGLPAPGNEPGPGAPKSTLPGLGPEAPAPQQGSTEEIQDGFKDLVPCPHGGGADCVKHGGSGGEHHEPDGKSMVAHMEFKANSPGQDDDDSSARTEKVIDPQIMASKLMSISDFKPEEQDDAVLAQHLESGKILRSTPLGDVDSATPGIMGGEKIDIDGNGSGLMKGTLGNSAGCEAGASQLFSFFKSDRCPKTVTRVNAGLNSSVMAWLADFKSAGAVFKAAGVYSGSNNRAAAIKHMFENTPDQDALNEQLSNIITMDTILNNKDRHHNNYMVNDDFSDIKAIDHGFTFHSGYNSYKEFLHEGYNATGRKVKVPPSLMEKFNNTSITDLSKALSGRVDNWQVAQTYLRMKYTMSLQKEHGHLPYSEYAAQSSMDAMKGIMTDRKGANEKFEDFAIDFMDKHGNDPSSPEHAAARAFMDVGILHMSSYTARTLGQQFEHEKRARVSKFVEESKRAGKGDPTKKLLEAAHAKVSQKHKVALDKLTKSNDLLESKKTEAKAKLEKAEKAQMEYNFEDYDKADKLNDAVLAAEENLNSVAKKYEDVATELRAAYRAEGMDFRSATNEVLGSFVPKGHEDTFNRLNSSIDRAKSRRTPGGRMASSVTKYSGVRSSKSKKTASDIESSKRGDKR